jgi:hypothetical protein
MSSFDVPPDEMGTDPQAADDAIDRMLSGGAPVDDEWRDVALFVQELQEAVPSSGLASQDLHVAAMVETARLLAEKGDPAVRPVSNAAAPAPQASGLPKQRRKSMKRSTRTLIRVLAPIAAVLTVFSGMAYAGALPHTVQKAVSTAASTVGIDLPSDDEGTVEAPGEDDQGEDTQGDDTTKDDSVTPVDESDDQGENDDNQGDNDNQGEDTQGDSTDETSGDDQGENDDNQGDNDNQGEDTQGDSTDETSGDDQGDEGGDSQSGDDQGSGGDQQGDSQD